VPNHTETRYCAPVCGRRCEFAQNLSLEGIILWVLFPKAVQ